jgi:hypothetical protein
VGLPQQVTRLGVRQRAQQAAGRQQGVSNHLNYVSSADMSGACSLAMFTIISKDPQPQHNKPQPGILFMQSICKQSH